jgi:adenylate cyclase
VQRPTPILRALLLSLLFATYSVSQGIAGGVVSPPAAVGGIITLSDADLRKTVALRGEWEFYWQRFLGPGDFVRTEPNDGLGRSFISVPSSWTATDAHFSAEGFATYRLVVELPEKPAEPLGLYLDDIASAYRLVCNGVILLENGRAAARIEDTRGTYAPRNVFFSAQGRLEIILQVSNREEGLGGVKSPPRIGYESAIAPIQTSETLIDAIVYSLILAMGLYHILLSILHPAERASFYFGLLALALVLRGALTGSRLLHQFAAGIGFHTLISMEFMTIYVASLTAYFCLYHLFPRERPEFARIPLITINAGLCIFVFIAPNPLNALVTSYYEFFLIAEGVLLLVWLTRALIARREGALIMLLGTLILIGGVGYDIILDRLYKSSYYISSYTMVIFIFLQAGLIARRYARAFNAAQRNLQITEALASSYSRFVPREFLSLLGKESIVNVELGDQIEMDLTVLFSDIRSFTSLSENMSPRENFNFLNSYLKRISPVIGRNGGFIDKYVGDGIMALFPRSVADALHASVEMLATLRIFNGHRANSGYRPISFGIGINTGRLMLGTVGESSRMEGTVISDVVNLASRLEGLTRLYGAWIIVGSDVLAACPETGGFPHRYLGKQPVKGKAKAVEVYEIIDVEEPQKTRTRPRFEAAVLDFEERRFEAAASGFRDVLAEDPSDEAARYFLVRLAEAGEK